MPEGKTLYLVRHANAGWPNSGQRDFDRPLNARGKVDAQEMGRRLNIRGIQPSAMLSSPAQRAFQTSELIATALGFPTDSITFMEKIYEAETSDLVEIIQSLNDNQTSAMLIGHNPAISWMINQLTGEHIVNAPTCTIATLRISSTHWKDAATGTSNLLDFEYPQKSPDRKTPHIS